MKKCAWDIRFESINNYFVLRRYLSISYSHDLSHGVNLFILRMNIDCEISLIISWRHRHIKYPIFMLFSVGEIIIFWVPASITDILFNVLIDFRIRAPIIRSMMMVTSSKSLHWFQCKLACAVQKFKFMKHHLLSLSDFYF